MRLKTAALILACACIATPSLAATTVTTSWEGTMTEMQKKGPYVRARGPNRGGRYLVSSSGRYDRPLWRYHWRFW